jgi:hypothetical protein
MNEWLAEKIMKDAIENCRLLGVVVMVNDDTGMTEPANLDSIPADSGHYEVFPNIYFISQERFDRGDY